MSGDQDHAAGRKYENFEEIMDKIFFLSAGGWQRVREHEEFDFVVVGSGFCGFAFAERALRNDPHARVLIIERGPFLLPEHIQNLPAPYGEIISAFPEAFPWALSPETRDARDLSWQRGIMPFFGGRSTVWSGWCPRPTAEELEGWPAEVVRKLDQYFADAESLLGVVPAGEIRSGEKPNPVYGTLQDSILQAVRNGLGKIPSATRVMAAPLAARGTGSHKFSTPVAWLDLLQRQRRLAENGQGTPLKIVTNCMVERIVQKDGEAQALETSSGTLPLRNAKLVLAMSALPITTLVMNSFPEIRNAGERYSAHFVGSVLARVPRQDFPFHALLRNPELAAIYLAGAENNNAGQHHIQLTAIADRNPVENAALAHRYMPDLVAAASLEQMMTSRSHLLFACAMVGELDYRNPKNWFRRARNSGEPGVPVLQFALNDSDRALWNTMEEAAFQMLEQVVSPQGPGRVEYWFGDGSGSWKPERPPEELRRATALFHEGSTLWIGKDDDPEAVVGLDYRPRGVKNVFITGSALWPRGGSWNPTLAMVSLAQHLADTLTEAGSAAQYRARTAAAVSIP